MSVIDRLFKIGQAEANAAIDKLENPVKLTEQGIRDMKRDLDKSLHALADVKAMAIRARNDIESYKSRAMDYEEKAIKLLKLAADGNLEGAEGDRLATEALIKKDESLHQASRAMGELLQFEESVEQLESNISRLKATIGQWKNELSVLKARARKVEYTQGVDNQASFVDSSGTIAMLERMKDKVIKDEALARAYDEIANDIDLVDNEINEALKETSKEDKSIELTKLKSKLGFDK